MASLPAKAMAKDSALSKPEEELAEFATPTNKELALSDTAVHADYSGASKKTDPEEIRLVRKLDLYILPIMWAMYYLNWIDR